MIFGNLQESSRYQYDCVLPFWIFLCHCTFLLSKHNPKQWVFQCLGLLFTYPTYSSAGRTTIQLRSVPYTYRSSTISHSYHRSLQIRCNTSCSLTKALPPPIVMEILLANLSMPTTSPYLGNVCTEKDCPLRNHHSHTQRWSMASFLYRLY
jgi:hypothetical protein